MNKDDEATLLHEEVSRAGRASRAYDEFVKPFFDETKRQLLETFDSVSPLETEALADIRRTSMILNELHDSIKSIITTGQMAKITLNERNENG